MSVQEIAEKMKSRVASAGFEHSVKFDTGSDGVLDRVGTVLARDRGLPDVLPRGSSS